MFPVVGFSLSGMEISRRAQTDLLYPSLTAVKGPGELRSCRWNSQTCRADVGRHTDPRLEARLFTTVNTGSCQNTLRTAAAPHPERGPVPPLSTLPSSPSSTNGTRPWRHPAKSSSLSHSGHIIRVAQSFPFNLHPTTAANPLQTDGDHHRNHSVMVNAAPPAATSLCWDWSECLADSSGFFYFRSSNRFILLAIVCLCSALQHLLPSIQPPLRSASHSESPFQVRYK